MLFRLLLLFIVVPFVELVLLLALADLTSIWTALGLVVVTGVTGTLLARAQGFETYRRIHDELSRGRMPTDSLLDAVMIFVAGALLLTPGLLTDALGLSLLIPPCRRWYRAQLVRWFKSRFKIQTMGPEGPRYQQPDDVIDSYAVDRPGSEDDG